jgi:RNA polymerase sigma-70 factor (ECF subfamily)
MEKHAGYIRLVKNAQLGDRSSLERLSKEAQTRLQVDVFRLTLEHDLTGDIVQETILEMLKILGELKEADRFWPWLYKIALNKLRLHHRKRQQLKTMPISAMPSSEELEDSQDAMSNAVSRELKEIVLKAMSRLRPQYRAILTMRCYRQMEFSLIAETLGCSEFAAKMQFYRAKKALRKHLVRAGLGKGSLLLALIVFGKITAPAEAAAVSVTASATKVGLAAGVVGALSGKTAIITLTTAGVIGTGALVATSGPEGTASAPDRAPVEIASAEHAEKTHEEYWYYYPDGPDGPVIARFMKSGHVQWVQDEEANWFFDKRSNTLHINNYRQFSSDKSIWRLPTDGSDLSIYRDGPGLVMVVSRGENGDSVWKTRHENIMSEEYFRYSWPAGVKVLDNRDVMHKRGWTYFTVEGRIGEERLSGAGRIPFVYAAGADHSPWLRLNIGDRLEIIDDGRQAIVRKAGKVTASYQAGSFFKGLSRPWMGLHTLDTVRRDAAEQHIPFETNYNADENKAQVVLTSQQEKLVYTVDMERDVVEKIAISTGQGTEGELRFSYLQDIDKAGHRFTEPRITGRYGSRRRKSPGLLWLRELVTRPAEQEK